MSTSERISSEPVSESEAARIARRARSASAMARARRSRRIVVGLTGIITALVVGSWAMPSEGATSADQPATHSGSAHEAHEAPAAFEVKPPVQPTPVFGRFEEIDLHLPVAENELTEIGFHRASGDHAVPIESLLPDADMEAAANKRGTGRVAPPPDANAQPPRVLSGTVLRMWRSNRPGPPNNSVDIGARPGATVYAPINGTVVAITPYHLYGAHEDIEIHIAPNGRGDLTLVIIHVERPIVSVGDQVVAGVTPIAGLRLLSDRIDHQLGQFSTTPGDHVHIQLNRVETPGEAIPAGGS